MLQKIQTHTHTHTHTYTHTHTISLSLSLSLLYKNKTKLKTMVFINTIFNKVVESLLELDSLNWRILFGYYDDFKEWLKKKSWRCK